MQCMIACAHRNHAPHAHGNAQWRTRRRTNAQRVHAPAQHHKKAHTGAHPLVLPHNCARRHTNAPARTIRRAVAHTSVRARSSTKQASTRNQASAMANAITTTPTAVPTCTKSPVTREAARVTTTLRKPRPLQCDMPGGRTQPGGGYTRWSRRTPRRMPTRIVRADHAVPRAAMALQPHNMMAP